MPLSLLPHLGQTSLPLVVSTPFRDSGTGGYVRPSPFPIRRRDDFPDFFAR